MTTGPDLVLFSPSNVNRPAIEMPAASVVLSLPTCFGPAKKAGRLSGRVPTLQTAAEPERPQDPRMDINTHHP